MIHFPAGIPGFVTHTEFELVRASEESVFLWLRSTIAEDIKFPVVIPWVFHWDYEIQIDDDDIDVIRLTDVSDLVVLCVVNVGPHVEQGTINLFSPIIINEDLMLGQQAVNQKAGYSTRDPLFVKKKAPVPMAMHGFDFATLTEGVVNE